VASVTSAERRLLKDLSDLSFCGRVETNFDTFVFKGWEESIDVDGASVGCLSFEEADDYEALDDSLLSSKGLLAFESSIVGKSRLDDLRDSFVCPNGRVVNIPCVRSFRCGAGSRRHRCHRCIERRVRGSRVNATTR
jgi:hypothetical protein